MLPQHYRNPTICRKPCYRKWDIYFLLPYKFSILYTPKVYPQMCFLIMCFSIIHFWRSNGCWQTPSNCCMCTCMYIFTSSWNITEVSIQGYVFSTLIQLLVLVGTKNTPFWCYIFHTGQFLIEETYYYLLKQPIKYVFMPKGYFCFKRLIFMC